VAAAVRDDEHPTDRHRSVSARKQALAWGLAIIALYVAGGVVSGHLSPLARRPLLDGIIPPLPYRWVAPPPELADSNLPPASGRSRIPMRPNGSQAAFMATDDAQVTLNAPKGAVPPHLGSQAVVLTIEPIDPASVGPLPGRLTVKGNVYVIAAAYQPGGDRIRSLDASIVAILTYPALTNDLGNHTLVTSPDGKRWTRIATHDQHATKQVSGNLRSLGYLAVASSPLASTGPDGVPPSGEEGIPLSILALVIGSVLLFVGVFLLGRGSEGRGRR
jgi:hypothetical protein